MRYEEALDAPGLVVLAAKLACCLAELEKGIRWRCGPDHPCIFPKRDKPSVDKSSQQDQLCHGILVAPDHGILFMLASQYPGCFK